MMRPIVFLFVAALFFLIAMTSVIAKPADARKVIYDNLTTEVAPAPASITANGDLWVTLKDLTRATKFVLKPQGVCRDELCFPLPKARRAAFLQKQSGADWFNLSEFARLVKQPVAVDAELSTWFFGPRADEQDAFVATLTAPDFTLPDANGKQRSLREFRGKKVLLLTWASW